MRLKRESRAAFTLIELLVVIAIIGILVGFLRVGGQVDFQSSGGF